MISYDPDCSIKTGTTELWCALGWIAHVWKLWFGTELTVTSLNDGTHMKGSLHYEGRAADIRTREWYSRAGKPWPEIHQHPREIREFVLMLRRELGPRGILVWLHPDDDVVNKKKPHVPHIHVGVGDPEAFLKKGSQ